MFTVATISNFSGAMMYLALTLLLILNWRQNFLAGLLLLACMSSFSFFLIQLIVFYDENNSFFLVHVDILRKIAFLGFLYVATKRQVGEGVTWRHDRMFYILSGGLCLFALIYLFDWARMFDGSIANFTKFQYAGQIAMAIFGLLLIEKLWRSTNPSTRWRVKFLCFGIGGMFAYELFLFSDAILFQRLENYLVDSRGAINAICAPLMAVSITRNPDWKMELFVSRHMVYYGTTTLATGLYLIIMATAGYYVRNTGAEWGASLQIIFLFGAVAILAVLFFSTDLRARLKIFITKHFYKNKYDYREEWLNFALTLADKKDATNIYATIIKAVTSVIKSPGGALWLQNEDGSYSLIEKLNYDGTVLDEISANEEFVEFLNTREWVINLDECRETKEDFIGPDIPEWLINQNDVWLIQPFYQNKVLFGFMLMRRPHGNVDFNWEDIDLLKTVGSQTGAYISLLKTSDALSEVKQFETFNRLSAFTVHDMKNIAAQLNLIVLNYPKYADNKEFIDDAMETIGHAINKINKLLGYLTKVNVSNISSLEKIQIEEILNKIIQARQAAKPSPVINIHDHNLAVKGDKDKLGSVLQHMIQNAQEATPDSGDVWVDVRKSGNEMIIEIGDNGSGMDENFIKTRLFKPFDTTKGNAGMGIGVYESRELIREMGGRITVQSQNGNGTIFRIILPVASDF